ncbi:MAG TPA: PEGA domain-containing protein [Polyangium sp.]|nr:PEGA domain-containing protein [Polyangium sp.]
MVSNVEINGRMGRSVLVASAMICVTVTTNAETTNSTQSTGAEATAGVDAAKKNASQFGNSGRQLMKQRNWAAALLEFEASNRSYPSWQALSGIGTCLTSLKRYDEALDAWETMLRKHSESLPEGTKKELHANIDLLRKETGAFMVTSATPGAVILVDGRWRGEHPLVSPMAVLSGRHWIRIYKEGFVIFEKEVEIPKGGMETLDAKLEALPNAGRMHVAEVAGRKMEVVLDGVPVGIAPWEGPVSPGPHTVFLRPVTINEAPESDTCSAEEKPAIPEDAGDPTSHEMGTEPEVVNVNAGQTSSVELKAEPLGAVVRVVPDPPDAEVYIDGVFMGRGPYVGRSKPGRHVVKTKADGYFEKTSEVVAAKGTESAPPLQMKKDVNAPKWAVAGRVLFEARASVPLANSFGGDLDAACTDFCQQSLGAGVNATFRGGYEWSNGLGFGATLGYFQIEQSHVGVKATIGVDEGARDTNGNVVLTPQDGLANDSTLFKNFMVGAYGSYKLGRRFPVRLGLGAGFMYGTVTYQRAGTFNNRAVGPLQQNGFFPWIYVEPEARVGVQITERWSIGVAISGLVLIAPKVPVWTRVMQVNAHGENPDQLGEFSPEKITANTIFAMNQGIYLQYGF